MISQSDNRSITAVIGAVIDNLQDIVRSETRLVKVELDERVQAATVPAVRIGAGIVFGIYAVGLAIVAGVALLCRVFELWAAAAIVAVVIGAAAAALIGVGRRRWHASQIKQPSARGMVNGEFSRH